MNIPSADSAIMQKIADSMGIGFTLHGISLTNEEVFAVDGALPLFYLAAKNILDEIGDFDMGLNFYEDRDHLFGVGLCISESNPSVRLLACTEALMGFIDSELSQKNTHQSSIDLAVLHARIKDANLYQFTTKPSI